MNSSIARNAGGFRTAALLLFASVVLHDDTYSIQPARWRFDRFMTNRDLPVEVDCRFGEAHGLPLRAELVTEDNLSAKLHHRGYETIASSTNGTLRYEIGVPGSFAILIINEDQSRPAQVSLRTAIDNAPVQAGFPRTLSPRRKATVMVLSIAGFFALVTFSGRRLLRAIRHSSESGT